MRSVTTNQLKLCVLQDSVDCHRSTLFSRAWVGRWVNHFSMFGFMCAYKYIISVIGRKS